MINGKNGLLVPPKIPVFVNAMIQFLNTNEDTIQKMGKESYNLAKDKYAVKR